jgi:hypothetical protein
MNRSQFMPLRALPQTQRGVGTLLISLVILTTITFILIYSARSVLTEQQLTSNDLRGRHAFEAAEAGQEAAVAYLSTPGGRDKDRDGVIDPVFDTDNDGVGDSNTVTMANGSRLVVNMLDVPGGMVIGTRVQSLAWSDDESAHRQINQVFAYVTPLPNLPSNPLLTRGSIVVNGSASVINPEGHSTIWSGGPVDITGNAANTTFIADPSATTADPGATPPTGGYPDCLGARSLTGAGQCATTQVSDRYSMGMDIIEQDTSLSNLTPDEFFFNFFGKTPAEYKQKSATIVTTPALSTSAAPVGADLAVDEVVWVDGGGPGGTQTNWNGISAGCTVRGNANAAAGQTCGGSIVPTIIVVDGDLRVVGNITIWGLLYVTGSISGAGNVWITGAVIMQGTNNNMTGNLTVTYNSEVLRSTADNGGLGGGGGTWRDF